jgi:hypothetical protein
MPTTKGKKSPKSQKADKAEKSEAWKQKPSDLSGISDELKNLIRQTVRAEIQSFLEEQTFPKALTPDLELPPVPDAKIMGAHNRPVNPGKRVKLASTVDSNLETLFQEWRRNKGMSLSKALDVVLWDFLGKPPLSFEISETSDTK